MLFITPLPFFSFLLLCNISAFGKPNSSCNHSLFHTYILTINDVNLKKQLFLLLAVKEKLEVECIIGKGFTRFL